MVSESFAGIAATAAALIPMTRDRPRSIPSSCLEALRQNLCAGSKKNSRTGEVVIAHCNLAVSPPKMPLSADRQKSCFA
jgi:hypothetical protein